MAWFAELAGKAESLLNNIDEQTGAALRGHNVSKPKKHDYAPHSEPVWSQKKRPIPRNLKRIPALAESKSNYTPARKSSPISQNSPLSPKKLEPKKPIRKPAYNLNNCPRTLVEVNSFKDYENKNVDHAGFKKRRFSLPSTLDGLCNGTFAYQMENLEIENAMLKNELNVMHREVTDLLERLRKTEDGEDLVVSKNTELSEKTEMLQTSTTLNESVNDENSVLNTKLEQLRLQVHNITSVDIPKYKNQRREFETEISVLRDRNKELEEKIHGLEERLNHKDVSYGKLDTDLRHTQSVVNILQTNLDKSNEECKRLERDWEAYKNRVKSMLAAKDKEIKALQQGITLTEDTRVLVEQIDNLKAEREMLSAAVMKVRGECGDMKQYMETLESRHSAAERVVVALRDALKDERAARNRAETQCGALAKELKSIQIETGQTIASLRLSLRERDEEVQNLKESTSSSMRSSNSSALNVADYDDSQESIQNDKIKYLTNKLIQRQSKIDELLADNNMMKIQLQKLESKLSAQGDAKRMPTHSVVHFQDGDRNRSRTQISNTGMARLSRTLGNITRRYPLLRILIIMYMVFLHMWVVMVLFTSTPENYVNVMQTS